jgi:flagellar biosynthesis chaperone FliJ
MKRFQWPLQRLLDVTIQRELAARAKLFALSRKIADVHREIFHHQASLRIALAELSNQNLEKRLPEQQVFMQCSEAEEERLDKLRENLRILKKQRSDQIDIFTKTKSSRETLERLREESLQRHERETIKEQQKQMDENAQTAFARKMISLSGMQSGMRSAT